MAIVISKTKSRAINIEKLKRVVCEVISNGHSITVFSSASKLETKKLQIWEKYEYRSRSLVH